MLSMSSPSPNSCNLLLSLALFASSAVSTVASGSNTPGFTAADYRRMADQAVLAGNYATAATRYRQEASVYLKHGDKDAASVEEQKADRFDTRIQLFVDGPADNALLEKQYTRAKFEPLYGCYVSAYVGNDSSLDGPPGGWRSEAVKFADRADALGKLLGKPLASSWNYCRWRQDFPTAWAINLLKRGIAPQVAWEPDEGLSSVIDDDYLENFARDIADIHGPVFIRFASEMNGSWTAYHGNPALYREKFRLVHDVLARYAPNAALIWCVNALPDSNYDEYYPGDDAVDWVGVNFYSVLHHDNDSSRPASSEQPTYFLRKIYDRFAARKPIAICEYGSSHQESLNAAIDYSAIASAKLATLLAALPRQFPRVKMIGLFDSNNLTADFVQPGRQLNNYSVTDSRQILDALGKSLSSPFYLSRVCTDAQEPPESVVRAIRSADVVRSPLRISACVQSYDLFPTVVTLLDGVELARSAVPGDHALDVPAEKLAAGPHRLEVRVYDAEMRSAGSKSVSFVFANADPQSQVASNSQAEAH